MNFLVIWEGLETRIGEESLSSILWFLGIVTAAILLSKPLSVLVSKLVCLFANRFSNKKHAPIFIELTRKPISFLLQTFLFFIAINQLRVFLTHIIFQRVQDGQTVSEIRISDVVDKVFLFLLILFTTLVVSRIIDFIFHVMQQKAYEENEKERQQLFPLMKEMVKIVVWTIGLFWLLGNVFNVNIPALVTGLGIGGIAIALAAKESVENFFAAFTILTDKPFQTGDSIKLGNLEGSVEQIGFRSTRLRNADGSLFIIPNKKLVNENLENLTQRDSRRVRLLIPFKYTIAPGELQDLMDTLKTVIGQTRHVKDPIQVLLDSFGENSFQLAINYHLPEPLPGGNLNAVKQEVSMKAYEIVNRFMAPA